MTFGEGWLLINNFHVNQVKGSVETAGPFLFFSAFDFNKYL